MTASNVCSDNVVEGYVHEMFIVMGHVGHESCASVGHVTNGS